MVKIRPISNESGMTLIELMIAIGILAVGLVIIFPTLISVSNTSQFAEDRAALATHTVTLVEELQGIPLSNLAIYLPSQEFLDDIPGDNPTVEVNLVAADGSLIPMPYVADTQSEVDPDTGETTEVPIGLRSLLDEDVPLVEIRLAVSCVVKGQLVTHEAAFHSAAW